MVFYVSRTDRRDEKHNTVVLRRPKLAHISVLLRSNSGAVPLANVSYRLFIKPGQVIEGTTDEDGLLEHSNILPGDYEVEIDGLRDRVLVPTLPKHIVRRHLRVPGLFLFEEDPSPEDDMAVTEEDATHFPLQEDQEETGVSEDDWEDVIVYEGEEAEGV